MPKLVGDIDAVVKHFKQDKAIIVGHDWGGIVAWTYAMTFPDKTDKLVILNLPHPKGLARELANNPQQQKNSQYARNFQQPDAASKMLPEMLTFWVKDPEARKKYLEAFKRSSMEGMLNYYKANYPREPYKYSTKSEVSAGQVPGADVPRPEGHGPAARRAERHLELAGQGPDAGHDSRRGPFRAARRRREGDQVHGRLADENACQE